MVKCLSAMKLSNWADLLVKCRIQHLGLYMIYQELFQKVEWGYICQVAFYMVSNMVIVIDHHCKSLWGCKLEVIYSPLIPL